MAQTWKASPSLRRVLRSNRLWGWLIALTATVPLLLPVFGRTPSPAEILLIGGLATFWGFFLFYGLCKPHDDPLSSTSVGPDYTLKTAPIPAFLFTAMIGLVILFCIQSIALPFAEETWGSFMHGSPQSMAPLIVLRVIGVAYGRTFNEMQGVTQFSFFGTLVSMLFSVGICEELVKLLPLLYLVVKDNSQSFRCALCIGAASGFGFGVAEGMHYSFGVYQSMGAPLSLYLTRFFGVACAHAVWTVVASSILFAFRNEVRDAYREPATFGGIKGYFAYLIVVVALSSAIAHALYDSFLLHGMTLLAAATNSLMVLLCYYIVNAHPDTSIRAT